LLLRVAGFQRGDDVLGCRDAAEAVSELGFGFALQKHRRVAGVRDGVLDLGSLVEQVGVCGGRVEGQHDGARLELRNQLLRNRGEGDVGNGEDHHIGVAPAVPTSVRVRPASSVRCWPAEEFST